LSVNLLALPLPSWLGLATLLPIIATRQGNGMADFLPSDPSSLLFSLSPASPLASPWLRRCRHFGFGQVREQQRFTNKRID
jgi:hypothetical protein